MARETCANRVEAGVRRKPRTPGGQLALTIAAPTTPGLMQGSASPCSSSCDSVATLPAAFGARGEGILQMFYCSRR